MYTWKLAFLPAFDLLRQRSQSANRKMRDVATELVERASGHPVSGPSPFEDPGGAGPHWG